MRPEAGGWFRTWGCEMRAVQTMAVQAAALAVLVGCGGGGSPSSPDPGRPNEIRLSDPAGQLTTQEPAIRELASSALDRVNAVLPLTGVTITVIADGGRAIGGYGLGGRTLSAAEVEIYLDPGFPNLAQLLPERLPPLVAHELHHARRFRGPGYGRTLLEAMISEGLADHFSIELMAAPVPPWSDAFPREDTDRYLDLARPEFDSGSYDHDRWFFDPSPSIPRWTGYTLGFRLVEAYQAAHGEASAAALVDTPAAAFRP
jgi:Predicted Zn-dependent protease (DUF2268)